MTELSHRDIYERLARIETLQSEQHRAIQADIARIRQMLEDNNAMNSKDRREIIERIKSLELINAERSGIDSARGQVAIWALRLSKWFFPYVPIGALATFALWTSDNWPLN